MPRAPAKPLKQPVQARSRHTVESILEAAVQVFEAHGYAAGTTARIAERAGVSVGTLYQYFPNKDAVVSMLADRHLADVRAFAQAGLAHPDLEHAPLGGVIDAMVDGFVAMHEANPRLHGLMSSGEFLLEETRGELQRIRAGACAKLAAVLARRPDVRRGNPEVMTYFVLECLEHFSHTLVLQPPPRAVRANVSRELKELLHRYLARSTTP